MPANRQVQNILSKLQQVTRSGRGWKALCPAHADVNPSLQIDVEGSMILAHCHAGCSFEQVRNAINTTFDEWRIPTREIVAIYDYVDEQGNLLYQKLRYEPKDFRQRRPDGHGGWIKGLVGVRRVIYRLNELQGAQRVYIPEGEKDVDRLASLGLVATCNDGGASKNTATPKWTAEHGALIVTAGIHEAVILPDNDDAGRAHAQAIARTLLPNGITVKIVTLPELPEHGDVSNWLDAGHTLEELQALVDQTPALETAETTPPTMAQSEAVSLDDLQDELAGISDAWEYMERVRTAVNDEVSENVARDRIRFVERFYDLVAEYSPSEKAGLIDAATKIFKGVDKATMKDAVRKRAVNEAGDDTSIISPCEPWDDEVDGKLLLDEMVDLLVGPVGNPEQGYMVMDREEAETVALWCLFSHAHDAFRHSPILYVNSPVRGCGKTTLLKFIHGLSAKSLAASNITTASIYQVIEIWEPTLIIDELDSFLDMQEDLRGILNSSHDRKFAQIIRGARERGEEPAVSRTWAAISIAMIASKKGILPPTIEDRSIVVNLKRKMVTEDRKEYDDDILDPILHVLKRKAARWGADHEADLKPMRPNTTLRNRMKDNWRPLLAIADLAGEDWPDRARKASMRLVPEDVEEDGERLLSDIHAVFEQYQRAHPNAKAINITSADLVSALATQFEESPWKAYNAGREITVNQIAKILGAFKIKSKTVRSVGAAGNQKNAKGYTMSSFTEVFKRYPPSKRIEKQPVPAVSSNGNSPEAVRRIEKQPVA